MNGLSPDLRKRAVAFYEQTPEATYASTAAQFSVGEASLNRWLRLKRETGDVAPRPPKKTSRFKVDLEWLRLHAEANPDARLVDRIEAFAQHSGKKRVSIGAMWGALHAIGFTHKKRRSTPRSGRASESRPRGRRSSRSNPR